MVHVLLGYAAFDNGIPDHKNCIRWQDDLTVGPVPATDTLTELSSIRQAFWRDVVAVWRFPDRDIVAFDPLLQERDEQLRSLSGSDEVVIWCGPNRRELLMVCAVLQFIETAPMTVRCPAWNVNTYRPEQLLHLFEARTPVTPDFVSSVREFWRSYTAPDPAALAETAGRVTDAAFANVLACVLREYPSVHNGLSDTEERLLRNSAEGRRVLHAVGKTMADTEDMPADVPLIARVWEFLNADPPLLEPALPDQSLSRVDSWDAFRRLVVRPTALGVQLLKGEADYVETNGLDRWIGGVHLTGHAAGWRFDRRTGGLVSD
jgi:hypothetical protein